MSRHKSILEKEFFTKGPQSLTIKQLLQIPSEFRTFQHCKTIIDHVKDVKFLQQYMDSEQIYDLAKEFQLKSVEANTVIFKQGDPADAFYIILTGSVKIYVTAPTEIKHFSSLKEVTKLEKGDAFGELALHYNSVRSATLVADENCDFITLDKESFRKHIRTISTSHMGQIMEFFKDFPSFQSLPIEDIAKYAAKSLYYKFPSNTVVIREHDQPNEIFFIKTGRVKVIKRLNFKVHPISKSLLLEDPREPTADDLARGNYKSMLIEVDELSHGDSFCDYSIFHKEPMHHSIVCAIPCELIALPLYDLDDMNERTMTEYKAVCKPYPDNTELRKLYLDLYRWNVWKKSLYKNIQIEKINKRRGFNQQLREPFLKMVQMENLSIPLEGSGGLDLLAMAHKGFRTSKAKKSEKSGLGTSALEVDSHGTKSTRAIQLPKISNRDGKTSSSSLLKSFEFVVPKHKLAYLGDNNTNSSRNGVDIDVTGYGDTMPSSNGYYEPDAKKAPYLYNLNSDSPMGKKDIEDIEEEQEKEAEGGKSVLGTRAIANTFSKAFNDVSLPGSVLPSIRR